MTGKLLTGRCGQLGYVTNDMDEALKTFARAGIAQFLRNDDVPLPVGGGREARINVAIAIAADMQIEIIQPTGGDDHVYRQVLDDDGFQLKLHHHCHYADGQDQFDAARAAIEAAGFPIVLEGTDPAAQYFYADLRPLLGHHIEYVLYDKDMGPALLAAIPVN